MPTILDYFEYAKLSTAAYVDLNGISGTQIAFEANKQERIPFRLAELNNQRGQSDLIF